MIRKRKLSDEEPLHHSYPPAGIARVNVEKRRVITSIAHILADASHHTSAVNAEMRFPKSSCQPPPPPWITVTMAHFVDWSALASCTDSLTLSTVAAAWSSAGGCGDAGGMMFHVVPDEEELWWLLPCDWHWQRLLQRLECRRQALLEMTAHITTLGGGWASVGERAVAHRYAMQQKRVARLLGDETLELLSDVYIGYGHLFAGRVDEARRIIAAQTVIAKRRGEPRQLAIVAAARIQLDRLGVSLQ